MAELLKEEMLIWNTSLQKSIEDSIISIAANNCGDQYVQIWLKTF